MTLIQYLCQLLSEECNQLGQRASKMSRFGKDEVQANQSLDNFERLRLEKVDLLVVYDLLLSATGKTDKDNFIIDRKEHVAKQRRIIEFTKLSVEYGQVTQDVLDELITHTLLAQLENGGCVLIIIKDDMYSLDGLIIIRDNLDFPNTVSVINKAGETIFTCDQAWTDKQINETIQLANHAFKLGTVKGSQDTCDGVVQFAIEAKRFNKFNKL